MVRTFNVPETRRGTVAAMSNYHESGIINVFSHTGGPKVPIFRVIANSYHSTGRPTSNCIAVLSAC